MSLQCGAPEPLAQIHRLDEFDCGDAIFDEWIKRRAMAKQLGGASRTLVVADRQHRVLGYYEMAAGAVLHQAAAGARHNDMADAVPVMVLSRLAVDRRAQGQGLGASLLQDAVARAMALSQEANVRVVLARAFNDSAKRFYEHFGFQVSPLHPMTLMLRLNSLKGK
jgi:GNAT superfamily N-acetyltransferase